MSRNYNLYTVQQAGVFVALLLGLSALPACESTDGDSNAHVSTSVYFGVGYYDSWYNGPVYYPPEGVVPPPNRPDNSTPRPEHPIANPPTVSRPTPSPSPRPMPSIPSAPRVSGRR
jgi:hypothetical protein